MIHRKLTGLMSDAEVLARTASIAQQAAESAKTVPAGSISVPSADGTRTVIGVANGSDGTGTGVGIAQWVGDTTAPGKPTGVTATSKSGVVIVSWDGTLDGSVPSDFDHVTVYLDGAELGCLKRAGSVASGKYAAGDVVSVTATAQDAARLQDGSLSPNVSPPTDTISVTVVDESLTAVRLLDQHFWNDAEGCHVSNTGDHDVSGLNSLWTSAYLLFRQALVVVARFGETVTLGIESATHVLIDGDSFEVVDGATNEVVASIGGSSPMLTLGEFRFFVNSDGHLTLGKVA